MENMTAMNAKMPSPEQRETYENIIKLYDYAEAIIEAIEQNPEPFPELRLKLVEPVLDQIEESAEVLAEIYIHYIETGKKPSSRSKIKVEVAIRKIFAAIDSYRESVKRIDWKIN